jgi:GTP-binding protein HflX
VDQVLEELEVKDTPQIRVMNKSDLLPEAQRQSLANTSSTAYVSAVTKLGLGELLAAIDKKIEVDSLQHLRVHVPQSEGKLLAQIEARAHILKRVYRDSAVRMDLEAPESLVRILQPFVVIPRARASKKN